MGNPRPSGFPLAIPTLDVAGTRLRLDKLLRVKHRIFFMRVGSRESGVGVDGNIIPETVLRFFPYSPFPIPYSRLLCIFNAQQLMTRLS